MNRKSLPTCVLIAAAWSIASNVSAAQKSDPALVVPRIIIFDVGLSTKLKEAEVLAARRYDTFWSTGNEAFARQALSPNFIDETLPPGREQGINGPLAAFKVFHAAVPDVHCDVEQMIVAGDRVVTHLRFTGHFTGKFKDIGGSGQKVDFIATDIYRIIDGQITHNWHLEDNLTFLTQLGVIKP